MHTAPTSQAHRHASQTAFPALEAAGALRTRRCRHSSKPPPRCRTEEDRAPDGQSAEPEGSPDFDTGPPLHVEAPLDDAAGFGAPREGSADGLHGAAEVGPLLAAACQPPGRQCVRACRVHARRCPWRGCQCCRAWCTPVAGARASVRPCSADAAAGWRCTLERGVHLHPCAAAAQGSCKPAKRGAEELPWSGWCCSGTGLWQAHAWAACAAQAR